MHPALGFTAAHVAMHMVAQTALGSAMPTMQPILMPDKQCYSTWHTVYDDVE